MQFKIQDLPITRCVINFVQTDLHIHVLYTYTGEDPLRALTALTQCAERTTKCSPINQQQYSTGDTKLPQRPT